MHKLSPFLSKLLTVLLLAGMVSGCGKKDGKGRFLDSAKKLFDAGEYEKAKIEYLNVLQSDPGNLTAISQLGVIWSEQGVPIVAAPYLIHASKASPSDIRLRCRLVSAYMSAGDARSAREEASAILDLAPDDEEALLLLVDSVRTPEDLAAVQKRMEKFPNRKSAAFHLASVPLYLQKRDLTSALDAVEEALKADPKSVNAHLVSAKLRMAQKDAFGAEQEFKTAADLAPVRNPARINYADFLFQKGSKIEALAAAAAITAAAPDYLPGWYLSARLAFASKNYDGALDALAKVFEIDGENYLGRLLQAEVLMVKGDGKAAVKTMEGLAENEYYSRMPAFLYQLARAHVQNAEPAKAIPLLKQATAAFPDYTEANVLLARLNLQNRQAAEVIESMGALLKKAEEKKKPAPLEAVVLLSDAYRSLGKLPEAVTVMKAMIRNSPSDPQWYVRTGQILAQDGKIDEAKSAFEEALKLTPSDLTVVAQLISLDVDQKKFEAALQRVQTVLDKTPESAEAWLLQGKVHFASEAWDKAEASLQKSIALDANAAGPAQLLVETLLRSGKVDGALKSLEKTLEKQPDNPVALLSASMIYEKQKEFSKARDCYARMLAAMPNAAPVMNNLAALYSGPLDDLGKAYEWASKARGLRPGIDPAAGQNARKEAAAIADTLGWIQYRRADYTQAFNLAREAASEFEKQPEVQYHLGMAASAMGRTDVALAALTTADAAADDFPARADAKARLALLKAADSRSVAEIEALLKDQPKDVYLQMLLAQACEREKDFPRAAVEYEKVRALNAAHVPAALNLARLYAVHLQKKDEALEIARKIKSLAGEDSKNLGILGGIVYEAGAYREAYGLLLEGMKGSKDDPNVLYYFALASYSQSDLSEARRVMEQLKKLLASTPDSPLRTGVESFLNLTSAPAGDRKALEALAPAAESILQKDVSNVPALLVRAENQLLSGDSKAAIAACNAILDKFPDFAPAEKQLAMVYAASPETADKAYHLALKARDTLNKIGAQPADLARTLAALCYNRKEFRLAALLFQEVALKNPLDANDLYMQGMSCLETKDTETAGASLKKAIAAGLPEALAAEADKALKELDKK